MPCAASISLPALLRSLLFRSVSIAVPALILAAALPVSAQHGHAGGGGFHSGGGFRSGGIAARPSSAPARSFGGVSRAVPGSGMAGLRTGRIRPVGPARLMTPGGRPSSGLRYAPNNLRRPEYGGHGGYGARGPYSPGDLRRPHRPVYNYGAFYTGTVLPYGYPGADGSGDLGFPYDDYYDDYDEGGEGAAYDNRDSASAYDTNPAYGVSNNDASNNYVAQAAPGMPGDAPEALEPPSPEAPRSASAYNYGSSQLPAQAAPLPPQEAVTLIFNNGAPSQQIRNYMLSRNTLTVLDGPRREIPISSLDLAATEKANRAAGVDFQLPAPR